MISSMKCLKTGCCVKVDHLILNGDLFSDKKNLYLAGVPHFYGNGDPNLHFDLEVKNANQISESTYNTFLLEDVIEIKEEFVKFNNEYNKDYIHLFDLP